MTVQRVFTAPILLPGNPSLPLQAVPKQYSDAGDASTLAAAEAASQPVNSNLTTIAGLTPTSGNVIQAAAGAWASETPAQVGIGAPVEIYPITGYEMVAASVAPEYATAAGIAFGAGNFQVTRMWLPPNTVVTGACTYVSAAGTTPGSTNASGFVMYSDTGTQLGITANDYTLFTTASTFKSKPFTGGTYTAPSTGVWVRVGMACSCSGTSPTLLAGTAYATLLATTISRVSTTQRRNVLATSVTTIPSSITPSTYGTTSTARTFFGLY